MMSRRKGTKNLARWLPLPPGATTMQSMVVPEIDDNMFRPDMMTKEELINCSTFIDQSNLTLSLENSIIEKYLLKMDPMALDKLNKVMEAAALALQKSEKQYDAVSITTFDGVSQATGTMSPESTTSRLESYSSNQYGKLGILGLSDRSPKVPTVNKIEIVNREIEELRTELMAMREKALRFNQTMKCRNEELSERLKHLTDCQKDFEQKLLIEGVDPITGKLPGEKFMRYMEIILKSEEMEIDRIRIQMGFLKNHWKKVVQELASKEEMEETPHDVEFEQLKIENRQVLDRLEEKNEQLIETKKTNGRFLAMLNTNRKKLQELMNTLTELQERARQKEKAIIRMNSEEEKINEEVATVKQGIKKIQDLMKSYTVPDIMEYIKTKATLHDLKRAIKTRTRQLKLSELAQAALIIKMKRSRSVSRAMSSSVIMQTSRSRIFM